MDKVLVSLKVSDPRQFSMSSLVWSFGEIDGIARHWDIRVIEFLAEGAHISDIQKANALYRARHQERLLVLESVSAGSAIFTWALEGVGIAILTSAFRTFDDAYRKTKFYERCVEILRDEFDRRIEQTRTLAWIRGDGSIFELEAKSLCPQIPTANDEVVFDQLVNSLFFSLLGASAAEIAAQPLVPALKFSQQDSVLENSSEIGRKVFV